MGVNNWPIILGCVDVNEVNNTNSSLLNSYQIKRDDLQFPITNHCFLYFANIEYLKNESGRVEIYRTFPVNTSIETIEADANFDFIYNSRYSSIKYFPKPNYLINKELIINRNLNLGLNIFPNTNFNISEIKDETILPIFREKFYLISTVETCI